MAELLATTGLTKRFGGLLALADVTLTVMPGEIHAIIGPNGAGKTTLVSALAGELRPDAGAIRFAGHDISRLGPARRAALGIARSFQITSLFREFTALDNVALAVQAHEGHSFRFWRPASRDPRLREKARAALAEIGLSGRADTPAAALSHGERRALELAMVLASGPRLLLLDEPMAGMGAAESAEIDFSPCPPQGPVRDRPRRARHGCGLRAGRPHHGAGVRARHRERSARSNPRRP